jgi:hypothetical protein
MADLIQPAYDTNAEHTTMAAADALYEIMSISELQPYSPATHCASSRTRVSVEPIIPLLDH